MDAGVNSGRVMELNVLDYAEGHVPCSLAHIVDTMARRIQIPVSVKYVQSVLESNGYRIVNEGATLIVDRAPEGEDG